MIVLGSILLLLFTALGKSRANAFIVTSLYRHCVGASDIRVLPSLHDQPKNHHHRIKVRTTSLSGHPTTNCENYKLFDVNGIICREVCIHIDAVGPVSILEATADSQNDLVEMACATEEEIQSMSKTQNNIANLHLNSGDPYGAVLWPAASAVANHLVSIQKDDGENCVNPILEDSTLLELGAGTGLVSIAAALGGTSKIMATDYEAIPLQLLKFAAVNMNHENSINNNSDGGKELDNREIVEERKKRLSNIETFLFDICDFDQPLPFAELVVAADIMYEPKTGVAMAHRVVEALNAGSRVIVGCSPGRCVT